MEAVVVVVVVVVVVALSRIPNSRLMRLLYMRPRLKCYLAQVT